MNNYVNLVKSRVNLIAMMALATFADDLKTHPTYGWRICNYAGEGDYNPNRRDIYTDGYAGYSFARAVMIAAEEKACLPNNDIWVEPDDTYARFEETDLCVWILENNCAKGDYTTLENMAAGRQNTPSGGVSDRTYDREYRQWVESLNN